MITKLYVGSNKFSSPIEQTLCTLHVVELCVFDVSDRFKIINWRPNNPALLKIGLLKHNRGHRLQFTNNTNARGCPEFGDSILTALQETLGTKMVNPCGPDGRQVITI